MQLSNYAQTAYARGTADATQLAGAVPETQIDSPVSSSALEGL